MNTINDAMTLHAANATAATIEPRAIRFIDAEGKTLGEAPLRDKAVPVGGELCASVTKARALRSGKPAAVVLIGQVGEVIATVPADRCEGLRELREGEPL
jgi:hypothetical protein